MNTQRLMVIGTQPIGGPQFAREAGAALMAGPNQTHLEVDAALPAHFASEADITVFHRSLEVHIAKLGH
jgi:hypothetical protein